MLQWFERLNEEAKGNFLALVTFYGCLALALVLALALSGCEHKAMTPEAVAAAVAKCKALDLKPQSFAYAWDGIIAKVQCVPKS